MMRWALVLALACVLMMPTVAMALTTNVRGTATWYHWRWNQAAAGPRLRHYLGANWRGMRVKVCTLGHQRRCTYVRLTDWCACTGRVIDLDSRSFRRLTPLWHGTVEVRVYR
jgi:hypothetical protein